MEAAVAARFKVSSILGIRFCPSILIPLENFCIVPQNLTSICSLSALDRFAGDCRRSVGRLALIPLRALLFALTVRCAQMQLSREFGEIIVSFLLFRSLDRRSDRIERRRLPR